MAIETLPPGVRIPVGTETSRLLLEPLQPQHAERDFAAVIESRDQLRLWSGSGWPAESFSLADNLQDLQWHWREHQERLAFTYTVLDPTRASCLGCVYIRPLAELAPANPELVDSAARELLVRFWVRTSRLEDDLEAHLLKMLIRWFSVEWPFASFRFETREANTRQAAVFAAYPLASQMTLHMPSRGGPHTIYGAEAL